MSESLTAVRNQFSKFRDVALTFFDKAEQVDLEIQGPEKARHVYGTQAWVWNVLPPELQKFADELRGELRPLMVKISASLRNSPLMSEADFRDLNRHAKTLAAALRFREFAQWGMQVHSDEDRVLGVDPPGQAETILGSVGKARALFTESYRDVMEMMDYWSPQDARALAATAPGENVRSYRENTAFLLMWINPEVPDLNDVRDTVQEVFKSFNIMATRADEIEHEGIITDRIINEIATSEFFFADLTGERPSVYYEVGYAHAIGKRVILYRRKGTKIHFDLAGYNCPEYESLGDLRKKLTTRLQALTNRPE